MRNLLVLVLVLGVALVSPIAIPGSAPGARAAEVEAPPKREWSFEGLFGTFDRAALQRGYQVYREVCAACHGMRQLYYRHLSGIGLTKEQIKAFAAEFDVPAEPNDDGEIEDRPARLTDRFKEPFANEQAARAANNGALPPDLSVIIKARKEGANYLYALLTGYKEDPPEGVKLGDGMYFNPYFSGGQIAMAPPLDEDAVEYADGTKATTAQLAEDLTVFMTWASEPELEERKRMGVKVLLFLLVLTGLLYAVKRKVWANVH